MDHGPPGGYYPDAKRQRTAKPDHAFSKQQSGYEFQQHKMNIVFMGILLRMSKMKPK